MNKLSPIEILLLIFLFMNYISEMGKILEVLVLEYEFGRTRTRTRTRRVGTRTRTRTRDFGTRTRTRTRESAYLPTSATYVYDKCIFCLF